MSVFYVLSYMILLPVHVPVFITTVKIWIAHHCKNPCVALLQPPAPSSCPPLPSLTPGNHYSVLHLKIFIISKYINFKMTLDVKTQHHCPSMTYLASLLQ